MRSAVLSLSVAVLILTGGLYLGLERPAWLPILGAEKQRVLVFLVGDPKGVERVRAAVHRDRIVAATPYAIALAEGRIVAVDADSASAPIMQAGWLDREIELFHVEKADPLARGRRATSAGEEVDPERMAKLRSLIHKPTLTAGEQLFVLQAMSDGLEF